MAALAAIRLADDLGLPYVRFRKSDFDRAVKEGLV
jgi:hypothetical protein